MADRILVLIRHAKSDWGVPASDRDRPLAARGRRQAPATGRWLTEHAVLPDLAVVSVAARARQTWDLVAAELPTEPPVEVSEAAYTFAGTDLLRLLAGIDEQAHTIALVGHNPAMEELARTLTGQWVAMPTSALAVLELPGGSLRPGAARIQYAGRPGDH